VEITIKKKRERDLIRLVTVECKGDGSIKGAFESKKKRVRSIHLSVQNLWPSHLV